MITFAFMIEKTDLAYERTVLVGIVTKDQDQDKLEEYLDELEFLTYTAGGEVVKRFSQRLERPDPKTFIGSGKMDDVREFAKENDIGAVIFDDELSPAQQRILKKS